MTIEITVRDTETGETKVQSITDDFVVITAGRHFVAYHQKFQKSGTHQLTIKVDKSGDGQ